MWKALTVALWAATGCFLTGGAMAQSLFRAEIATDGLASLELAAFSPVQPLDGSGQSPLAMGGKPVMAARAAPLGRRPAAREVPAVLPRPRPQAGESQRYCLTEAIYFEARGESARGQQAVAEVILNRVDSPRYPDTICEVVNQGTGRLHACQFSYTCDGLPETVGEPRAWDRAAEVADRMLGGAARRLTGNATHYHATYVAPHWAKVYPRTAQVGTHVFYRQIPGR